MLLPPAVRIRTDADLTATWRVLRGGLRFADLSLWLLVIDERGHPGPLLALAGLPDGPYDVEPGQVGDLVGDVLRHLPGASVALLYARPGADPWHLGDRAWGRFLHRLPLPVPAWPLHRAHDGGLELVADPSTVHNRSYG